MKTVEVETKQQEKAGERLFQAEKRPEQRPKRALPEHYRSTKMFLKNSNVFSDSGCFAASEHSIQCSETEALVPPTAAV